MRLKAKLVAGFLILSAVSGIIGIISLYQLSILSISFEDVQEQAKDLSENALAMEQTSQILYYDEILTQSVRNYAFTGDPKWKERYFQFEPILDRTLASSQTLFPHDAAYFDKISIANKKLVEIETQAISLIDAGKLDEAVFLLESDEYNVNKQLYSQILQEYSNNYNVHFGNSSHELYGSIEQSMMKFDDFAQEGFFVFEISLIVLVGLSIFLGYVLSSSIVSPFSKLQKELREVAKGEFDVILVPEGPDEVKELIRDFNMMIQDLKKIDYTKRNITAIVSHELRTPLVPMMGLTDILLINKSGNLTEEQKHKLEQIREKCLFMKNLIADIIDLNKIHEGHLSINKQIVSLDAILRAVIDNFDHTLKQKNIELKTNLQNIVIDADKIRLIQVFSNLLSNAIKFCPPSDGKISISTTYVKNNAKVVIKDNGEGLAQQNLAKIFDAYYQVADSYTRKHGGTGIGLAVCKGIIESHDGSIWAESEGAGTGTEIHVLLPILNNRGLEK